MSKTPIPYVKKKRDSNKNVLSKKVLVMELIDVKDTQIQRDVKTETYKYRNKGEYKCQ